MRDVFERNFLQGVRHKTPFFLFSKDKIKENYRALQIHFPHAAIHYALKANSEPQVLKTIAGLGGSFEAASAFELKYLKDAGVKPEKIIYGTSVKPASHIKTFFEYGVNRFAFDSFSELEKIAALAPGARVYVRVSVDDTGSVYRFSEKFGAEKEYIVPLLERARDLGLVPYGVSFHVGSQASNPKAWANSIISMRESIEQLHKHGIDIEILDIGGGYPCAYASTPAVFGVEEIAHHIYAALREWPYKPKLILEPGRYLIADTGILIASVIARVERRGSPWLFLDAGVYNALHEVMSYQGSMRYRVSLLRDSFDAGETLFALAGPTGDSPDVITREALLPQDVEVGDKLVFHATGAYSLVVSSSFNGFPKPAVYFV